MIARNRHDMHGNFLISGINRLKKQMKYVINDLNKTNNLSKKIKNK